MRFQELAFPMGKFIGVNAFRINRTTLKQRLIDGAYQIHETPHFLVCTKTTAPIMIVHWFSHKAIDSDLGIVFHGRVETARRPGEGGKMQEESFLQEHYTPDLYRRNSPVHQSFLRRRI